MAEQVDATDLKSVGLNPVPVRFRFQAILFKPLLFVSMWFTIYRTGELNTNERLIAFYKKELWTSRLLDTAKKQKHYGTKRFRKFVEYRFPSARRYKRTRALVSLAYKKSKAKYAMLAQLGKIV